ncbi:hypothetical protein K0M31_013869 [Melipona bicolor]|uniref:Transmembrane protein n=1 Tax=Melipona bicolor TaxID=60889 RepID=A0AA40G8L9_9HYME|nr:hypothetical protein K0M31_013869 [Melipona bicolor]
MSKEENSDGAPQEGPGSEASKKDADIYENRGTKKIIRLVTVLAYMFSVSFVAIVLSAYYLFLWEPPNPRLLRRPSQLSSEPEIQFLISDQEIIQNESRKPGQHANATYISFSNRFDDAETFVNNDRSKNREESLFLLRKSLIESLKNKINDSKSSVQNSAQENWTSNFLNYTTSKKEKTMNLTRRSSGRDERNSSKIMNRIFGNNNDTSQILESSTISGDEVNNGNFTNTRNHSVYETSRDIFRLNRNLNIVTSQDQYKKDVSSNFKSADTPNKKSVKVKYPAINNKDLYIQKNRDDRTYNINNINQATDLNEQSSLAFSRNSEFVNHPEHPEQSNQSPVKLANIALKFKGK